MQAEERIGAEAQQREVERLRHPPGGAGQERIGRRAVDDRVAVRAPLGVTPGVEGRVDHLGVAHHDLGAELARDGVRDPARIDVGVADRQRHHLAPRVHAGVGASGTGERELVAPQHRPEHFAQHAFDGALLELRGEPAEVGAVVRDRELEHTVTHVLGPRSGERKLGHTSSMRAMGALSPGRGPSFRIRR